MRTTAIGHSVSTFGECKERDSRVCEEEEACAAGGTSWVEESLDGVAGAGEGAVILEPIDYEVFSW